MVEILGSIYFFICNLIIALVFKKINKKKYLSLSHINTKFNQIIMNKKNK